MRNSLENEENLDTLRGVLNVRFTGLGVKSRGMKCQESGTNRQFRSGGHRGTFTETDGAGLIGTMALVPQVVDAVRVPVIAAGGIADGRGIGGAAAARRCAGGSGGISNRFARRCGWVGAC